MDERAAINGAMLALVPRSWEVAGRDRHRSPALDDPAWIVGIRDVLNTRHFPANGPIQHRGWGWLHGNAHL